MKNTENIKDTGQKKPSYILDLISKGEGVSLDFKFEVSDAKKIARSLCAFANTKGGTLLIGVKDNGIVAGVRSEEELYMVQSAAEYYSKPKVPFKIRYWSVYGKTVMEVIIPVSKEMPHFAIDENGVKKAYIRAGDKNITADDTLQLIWEKLKRRRGILLSYTDKEQVLLKHIYEKGIVDLDEYSQIAMIPSEMAREILSDMAVLSVLDYFPDEGGTYFRINKAFDFDQYLASASRR